MIRCVSIFLAIALTACSSVIRTGEPLADLVVSREAGALAPCVALGGPTLIFAEDDEGPPAMLHPESFKDDEARTTARKLQVQWRDAPAPTYQTFGTIVGDRCLMAVNRPTISGDLAFVGFSDPGGEMGAYVFRRSAGEWHIVERVVRGYW